MSGPSHAEVAHAIACITKPDPTQVTIVIATAPDGTTATTVSTPCCLTVRDCITVAQKALDAKHVDVRIDPTGSSPLVRTLDEMSIGLQQVQVTPCGCTKLIYTHISFGSVAAMHMFSAQFAVSAAQSQ